MKNGTELQKVSVKIWRDLIPKLDKKIEAACLRRDAYLSKVIGAEVRRLDSDVSVPNSEQAVAFISQRLDRLDRKLVSFTLDATVAEQVNKVCADKHIVRDAFFNRLIFWLVAPSNVVDRILGVGWDGELREAEQAIGMYREAIYYPFDDSLMDALVDPLWPIHEHFKLLNDGTLSANNEAGLEIDAEAKVKSPSAVPRISFYTYALNDRYIKNVDLSGLNTYLSDIDVPGTSAQREFDGDWEVSPVS